MLKKIIIFTLIISLNIVLNPIFTEAFQSKPSFKIVNQTDKTISYQDIEKAYERVYEKYRKVMPKDLLDKIDSKKIDTIYIVEKTSRPEVSESGLTTAMVNPDNNELESLTIEVKPGHRKGLKFTSFNYLIEHELAHAFAFMMQLPQATEIGHTVEIEKLKIPSKSE